MIHSPSPSAINLKNLLQTDRFGRSVRFFDTLESTNSEAMNWAHENGPEGALVWTEFQTAGRGRQGRSWSASYAKNLLFSLILRPTFPTTHWGVVTVAASLAVAQTIDHFLSPVTASIKWPNDVLLEGRKCCGILTETITTGHDDTSHKPLVLGIGINVNQDQFPQELETKATSLLLESGRHIPRTEFLAKLIETLECLYDSLQSDQRQDIIEAYQARMAYLHRKTCLRFSGQLESIEGIIQGISPTGALRFETADGERIFHAGEVTSQ